jgi:hypothetical protein
VGLNSTLDSNAVKAMPPGVNFINILCAPFFIGKYSASFSLVTVGFVVFWQNNIDAKAAHVD